MYIPQFKVTINLVEPAFQFNRVVSTLLIKFLTDLWGWRLSMFGSYLLLSLFCRKSTFMLCEEIQKSR